MNSAVYAVVTGDINASRKLMHSNAKNLESVLKSCFDFSRSGFSTAGLTGFSVFRGDSWQFAIAAPHLALRVVLYFKAQLLAESYFRFQQKTHTSAAIGFGSVDFLPDSGTASGGGEAFILSGQRVDMIRTQIPGMGVAGLGNLNPCVDCLVGLMDALVRDWTPMQAQATAFALCGLSQKEIAKRWTPKITQQAVQKHLKSARWAAIEPGLDWFETTIKGCKSKNNQKENNPDGD